MKNLTFMSTAAALLFAGATAMAEPGPRGGHWDRLDADGDGRIAVSELNERHRAHLADADADGDGYITKEEMLAFHQERRKGRAAKFLGDADGDGVVSRAEFDEAARARFEELDADGDGVISEDELKARRSARHGKRGGR